MQGAVLVSFEGSNDRYNGVYIPDALEMHNGAPLYVQKTNRRICLRRTATHHWVISTMASKEANSNKGFIVSYSTSAQFPYLASIWRNTADPETNLPNAKVRKCKV